MVANCPKCEHRLWQVILDDPEQLLAQCPKCGETFPSETGGNDIGTEKAHHPPPSEQFERITPPTQETEVETWSGDSAEYFPRRQQSLTATEAPDWLSELEGERGRVQPIEDRSSSEADFSEREREEANRRLLRSQGYVMDADSKGMRLTSVSSRVNRSQSALSPYDIVRLASEFEGGVVPIEERINCPACEAIILPTDKICQWCSAPLA